MDEELFQVAEVQERGICVLRVCGELDFDKRREFNTNIDTLIASEQDKLVVDLTEAKRIFSVYLGTLVDLNQRALGCGKTLSILAQSQVVNLFVQANLDKILTIVEVNK